MKTIAAYAALVLLLCACGQQANGPAPESATPTEPGVSIYEAALKHTGRPAGDLERDAGRLPNKVLEFLQVGAGDSVLDMFSGGGYYTELLSHIVGESGHVTTHTNSAMQNFSGDEFNARLAADRLTNVVVLSAENNELELDANRYDAVIMTLNYHDLYWVSKENGWEKIDVESYLAEVYKGLKPGGTFGIVDHHAEAGAPRDTGGTLHRIDPGVVLADLELAGFVADGESDVLRNMDDDHNIGVFDPSVRGKTDRFVLRFKKPEE